MELDNRDTDHDRLSDCLERVLLGTQPNLADSDLDGIADNRDLLPGAAATFTLSVKIAELVDLNKECDPKKWGSFRWWDPYLSHGYLLVDTVHGGQDAAFIQDGLAKEKNRDEKYVNPADVVATLTLPSNAEVYLSLNAGLPPLMGIKIGLLDYDIEGFPDKVGLRAGGDLVAQLPITLGPKGENTATWHDPGSGCTGSVKLALESPVKWEVGVAAVLARTQGLVTYEEVRSLTWIAADQFATVQASGPTGHSTADLAAEMAAGRATSAPDVATQKLADLNGLAYLGQEEHPLRRIYADDLVGGPVRNLAEPRLAPLESPLACVPQVFAKAPATCGTGGLNPPPIDPPPVPPIPTPSDPLDDPPTDTDLIRELLEACGVDLQPTDAGGLGGCDELLDDLGGLPETLVGLLEGLVEEPGECEEDGKARICPGDPAGALRALLEECGVRLDATGALPNDPIASPEIKPRCDLPSLDLQDLLEPGEPGDCPSLGNTGQVKPLGCPTLHLQGVAAAPCASIVPNVAWFGVEATAWSLTAQALDSAGAVLAETRAVASPTDDRSLASWEPLAVCGANAIRLAAHDGASEWVATLAAPEPGSTMLGRSREALLVLDGAASAVSGWSDRAAVTDLLARLA